MVARKIREIFTLIVKDMIIAKTIMIGARTATRMIIWYAFCTFVTSVVRRVTILAVENLSILEKEKFWIR